MSRIVDLRQSSARTLADLLGRAAAAGRRSQTGAPGVTVLGPDSDVVWTPEGGSQRSVKTIVNDIEAIERETAEELARQQQFVDTLNARLETASNLLDTTRTEIAQSGAELDTRLSEMDALTEAARILGQSASDAAATAAQAAADADTLAQAAQGKADQAASDLLALAGKTGRVIRSTAAPTGADRNVNNLWLDTSTGKLHQWTGSAWEVITDERLTQAITSADAAANLAQAAQSQADNAANLAQAAQTQASSATSAASTAQASATAAHSAASSAQSTASTAQASAAAAQTQADSAWAKALASAAAGGSLILNGGFEQADASGQPVEWSSGSGVTFPNGASYSRSGTRSTRLTSSGSGVFILNRTVPASSGRTYYLEAWARRVGGTDNAQIGFVCRRTLADGTVSTPGIVATTSGAVSSGWTRISAVYKPSGDGIVSVSFGPWVSGSDNSIRFDDLLAVDVTEAVAAQERADQAAAAAAEAKDAADAAQAAALLAQAGADDAMARATTADQRMTIGAANPTAADAVGKPINAVWEVRSGTTRERRFVLTEPGVWTQVKLGQDFVGDKAIGRAQVGDAAIGTAQIADLSVTNGKLGDVDIGKLRVLTTALLNEAVIAKLWAEVVRARSITTDMLLVGDGANLMPNGWGTLGTEGWGSLASWGPTTGPSGVGVSRVFASAPGQGTLSLHTHPTNGSQWIEVQPGKAYLCSFWVKANKSGSRLYIEWRDQDGARGFTSQTPAEMPNGGGAGYLARDIEPTTNWVRWGTIIVPNEGVSRMRIGSIYFNHSNGSVQDAQVLLAGFTVKEMVDASLIVDGGILARHITASESLSAKVAEFLKVAASEITTGTLAAGVEIIAGNPNGYHAKLSNTGLQIYAAGESGPAEIIRWGTGSSDVFALTDGQGRTTASIDEAGRASFSAAEVGSLRVGGVDIADMVASRREIVGRGWWDGNSNLTGAWQTMGDIKFRATEGHLYALTIYATVHSDTAPNDHGVVDVSGSIVSPSTPNVLWARVSSPGAHAIHGFWVAPSTTGSSSTATASLRIQARTQYGTALTWRARSRVVIEDWGPMSGVPSTQITGPTTTVQSYVSTWRASRTVTSRGGSLRGDVGTQMRQGGADNMHGVALFADGAVAGDEVGKTVAQAMSGATIQSVRLFLHAEHWWYHAGGTAQISTHTMVTPTDAQLNATPSGAKITVPDWPKPGGRWVDITSIWTTASRGIALGKPGTNLTYYGWFAGTGSSQPPLVEITYTR